MTALAASGQALLAAHRGGRPLVLANVWDVASAKLVEAAGFPVITTSSRAIAATLGLADDDSSDPDVIFGHLGRIASAVQCPITADLEAGYRLAPAELVERMLATGIVGCNLEDSDHHGSAVLVDVEEHAAYLAAVRTAADQRGVHVVINARVDCFIRRAGSAAEQLLEGIRRGRRYLQAGADCVYPIALVDAAQVARFLAAVPGPVNVQARRGGLDLDALSMLGVHRVSLASGLFQLANDHLRTALGRLVERGLARLWQETSSA